jgi:hypothetical protein
MYTLLNTAKKNMGDFLIWEKSRELIATHTGTTEFLVYDYWDSLDPHLEEVNATRAVVLCGGPAYEENFYPDVYRLSTRLEDLKVPVIPLGVGWAGRLVTKGGLVRIDPNAFQFTADSRRALARIHSVVNCSGVRDVVTRDIVKRHGWGNVVLTGCPALFDQPSIGRAFQAPAQIRRVVFTIHQNRRFHRQCIETMKRLRKLFPEAELFASFHRGLRSDRYTGIVTGLRLWQLRREAESLGATVVDAAYGTGATELYRTCDMHVGYRLHAHIFFLSLRKPSFLIHEDGRGSAFAETVQLAALDALDDHMPDRLETNIRMEITGGFPGFDKLAARIDALYEQMKYVLSTFP